MTTKPPSPVEPAPADLLEKKAYESVAGVATLEPNDRYRLGYHVWRFLVRREGTLEQAVAESGARILVPRDEASKLIRAALAGLGIEA